MDYKDENTWLMLGDCLERMKEIPDNSVDAVVSDPLTGLTSLSGTCYITIPILPF